MRIKRPRAIAVVLFLAAAQSCSSPTEPHSDILLARRVWLTSRPQAYSFEFASATSWTPKTGYYRVEVTDGRVQAAVDSGGRPAAVTLTIDTLWTRLLAARERGELNSALFNRQGVPVEVDWGPWELDGGIRFWVRNFVRR